MPFETIQKDPAAFRLLPAAGGGLNCQQRHALFL